MASKLQIWRLGEDLAGEGGVGAQPEAAGGGGAPAAGGRPGAEAGGAGGDEAAAPRGGGEAAEGGRHAHGEDGQPRDPAHASVDQRTKVKYSQAFSCPCPSKITNTS